MTLACGMAGDDDALPIRANARVSGVTIKAGETVGYPLGRWTQRLSRSGDRPGRGRWSERRARDGVAIRDVAEIAVTAPEDSEIVLVDAA